MKAKLLRKIRRRFDWYMGTKGFPVLVDHKNKTATKFDEQHFRKYFDLENKEEIPWLEITMEQACFRLLKTHMLKPFGFDIGNITYNLAKRLAKRHKNFSNEDK